MKRIWGIWLWSLLAVGPVFAAPDVRPLPAPPPAIRVVATSPSLDTPQPLPTPDAAYAKVCAQHWKEAKAEKSLATGDTYPRFMARCQTNGGKAHVEASRVRTLKTPPVDARPLAKMKEEKAPHITKKKRPPTAKQKALYARMRACGALWRKDKVAGAVPAGQKWPQYWSHCNMRLKQQGR